VEEGGMREEGEESEEIAECEMEIDSGESSPAQSPPLTTPFDSAVATTDSAVVSETSSTAMADKTELQAKDTPTNATVGDPGPTSSAPQRVNSDVVSSDVMMAHGGKAGEPESSPEPLPPGVEVDKKTAAQSSAPPPEAGKNLDDTAQPKGEADKVDMDVDEPVPPGMEPDQPSATSQAPVSETSDRPPTPPAAKSEVTEVKQTPPTTTETTKPPLPPTPETTQAATASPPLPIPSQPPVPSTPSQPVSTTRVTTPAGGTPTPQAAVVSTSGASPYDAQAAATYYATSSSTSQGYDVAAAAAAYAQATNTGQPYQYPQYTAQQGYDYATYTAYMQQMGQSMYGGGYVLGADGQYYQQANPYGAYVAAAAAAGAYGGYYAPGGVTAYSYASPTAYQTAAQHQVAASTAVPSTSTSEADKKDKAKRGEFALPDSKEKQMKTMMNKWSSFKET
jgi:hypothetical protein